MKAAVYSHKEIINGDFQGTPVLRVPKKTRERYIKVESNSTYRIGRKLGRKPVLPIVSKNTQKQWSTVLIWKSTALVWK
jgi:hypothetical protein